MAPSFFAHERALVEKPERIGAGTRVWAFAHVLPGASVGADCNLCDGVFIENDVVIGDRVTVKCGVQVWDGVRLEDDVFVGPNATFTNDAFPRSRQQPERFPETVIEKGASIGANATILPGRRVGRGALIGAGAVVTKDVPPFAVVTGNPGRVTGLAGEGAPLPALSAMNAKALPGNCTVIAANAKRDPRGLLTATENFPFVPKRFFTLSDMPEGACRGAHAHRECHQLITASSGTVQVGLDDGRSRAVVTLAGPTHAVHVPPKVWVTVFQPTEGASVLVLASHGYDEADYLRRYPQFLEVVGA